MKEERLKELLLDERWKNPAPAKTKFAGVEGIISPGDIVQGPDGEILGVALSGPDEHGRISLAARGIVNIQARNDPIKVPTSGGMKFVQGPTRLIVDYSDGGEQELPSDAKIVRIDEEHARKIKFAGKREGEPNQVTGEEMKNLAAMKKMFPGFREEEIEEAYGPEHLTRQF